MEMINDGRITGTAADGAFVALFVEEFGSVGEGESAEVALDSEVFCSFFLRACSCFALRHVARSSYRSRAIRLVSRSSLISRSPC